MIENNISTGGASHEASQLGKDALERMEVAQEAARILRQRITEFIHAQITSEGVKLSEMRGSELTANELAGLLQWLDEERASLQKQYDQIVEALEKNGRPFSPVMSTGKP